MVAWEALLVVIQYPLLGEPVFPGQQVGSDKSSSSRWWSTMCVLGLDHSAGGIDICVCEHCRACVDVSEILGFVIMIKTDLLLARSPTAGGQYHFVSEYAPPQYQKLLSYITGQYIDHKSICSCTDLNKAGS